MFDFLLKPFSPLTAFYNSLVVVNCAFQQFEIKQLSYDPIQADQIIANYNYNPFAGQDAGVLVINDIEEDYTTVDKLMENVDDDYCLTHYLVGNGALDADIDDVVAAATAATPAHLVGYLHIFVTNVIENITCSFIFGALLSCDFILSEKKSIEDFVHVKSKELKNNRILRCRPKYSHASSSSLRPKMRGFGVDFGVPGVKYVKFASVPNVDSVVPDTDVAAVVPVYPRWKTQIRNEVARRRESYIRFNREHEDIDGWGFIGNDFSIQAAN
ncbi:hypothetical protein HMPREF1544_01458 [Mucor circinelloides 1006PhL]|uniref:Uncharacterized protein n=1 Tax=Mucor circinelloides f. circinelloides (strain 1006PhL) TaxID=1220926 RepID=S2JN11_MUCC1|nr:hypothetical protein HMPREF1544_01458 [Mucor circinelloides 1006PhL]KAG1089648.1 hypothetical protein G6F42_019920 [Rhizopus arrhizus]